MKDKKLEEQFNEYFEGAEIPEGLAKDAKKYVKKPVRLPNFLKYFSVAASFLLCIVVAIMLIMRGPEKVTPPDSADIPSISDNNPSEPSEGQPQSPAQPEIVNYYSASDLTVNGVSAYSLSQNKPELKFLSRLALTKNADVTAYTAEFDGGQTAFIRAEITLVDGGRDETEMFIEYAEDVYEPLKDYHTGKRLYYGNKEFYITSETAENGEPVSKVYTQKDGVKYYFSVTSSNIESYKKYLKLIFG